MSTFGVDVLIVMGSESDYPTVKAAEEMLTEFGIRFDTRVTSAHRTPELMAQTAKRAAGEGFRVIIAAAGGAAHLPGMMAAYSELPVIGIPIANGVLEGQDALLSIAQMPKGVPVATVAIGGGANAGILAAQILATDSSPAAEKLRARIRDYKLGLEQKVLATALSRSPK